MFAAAGVFVVAVVAPNSPASAAAGYVVDINEGTDSVADFVVVSLAVIFIFSSVVVNISSSGVTFFILSAALTKPSVVVGAALAGVLVFAIGAGRFVCCRHC